MPVLAWKHAELLPSVRITMELDSLEVWNQSQYSRVNQSQALGIG
jgi:hypothetical protein